MKQVFFLSEHDLRQIFFLTLPGTSILTLMFLDWLVSRLWQRFRGHKDRGGHLE